MVSQSAIDRRLCLACVHHTLDTWSAKCTRHVIESPVDGSKRFAECADERASFGACKPDGQFFAVPS